MPASYWVLFQWLLSEDPAIGSYHVDDTSNLWLVPKSDFCATGFMILQLSAFRIVHLRRFLRHSKSEWEKMSNLNVFGH